MATIEITSRRTRPAFSVDLQLKHVDVYQDALFLEPQRLLGVA
jgi:hypothetical protein